MITYETTEQDGITYILQKKPGYWRMIQTGDDWVSAPPWIKGSIVNLASKEI